LSASYTDAAGKILTKDNHIITSPNGFESVYLTWMAIVRFCEPLRLNVVDEALE
jgi:hypothetical protein